MHVFTEMLVSQPVSVDTKTFEYELTLKAEVLTVLPVQQNLEAVGLIIIKGLSDFLYRLFVCQFSVHETIKQKEQSTNDQHFKCTVQV